VQPADQTVVQKEYRIMASPIDTARAVLHHAGIELGEETEAGMREWLRRAPSNHSKPRRYDLAIFGFDPHVLRAQFPRYTDRFGVELEWHGSNGSWV